MLSLEKGFHMIEDFADVNKDLDMIQSCAENIDNILWEKTIFTCKDLKNMLREKI